MDKNMINIDEVVKQRLSGGEEQEMPGSWLRMRELLDQEMPQKKRVAGYYNWRRMFGVMTGLVLLSALSVGSYNLITSSRIDNEKAMVAANTKTEMKTVSSKKISTETVSAQTPKSIKKEDVNTAPKSSEKKSIASSNQKSKTTKTIVTPQNTDNTLPTTIANSKSNKTQNISAKDVAVEVKTLQEKNQVSETSKHVVGAIASHTNSSNSSSAQQSNSEADKNIFASASANATKTTNNRSLESSKTQSVENRNAITIADNTRLKTPAPIQPNLPKDSMNKMTVVQRLTINPITRISKLNADTIAVERLAIHQPTAAITQNATIENVPAVINPAASNASAAEAAASSGLVPLSNMKVQSRKTSRWNSRSFDEVVRDVTFNLAQTKFYPGISAGGNSYMFGPNNIGGFQLGVFGLFTFGEAWSVMGELKYLHRFNNGTTFKDNYVDLKPAPQGGYLQANVEHFFKFTALQSIEMPLALRYAAGRVNVFGGINLAYHFAVNAEEITLNAPDTSYKAAASGQIKGGPGVVYHDFRARFALGGLAGISYEVSPSLQLDFRATKNVWDNGYGLGAEQVSRQLYNAPSMQFSIFYRFSQKNQIPKAR
ncbi:MAG TPA: porin family protein [Flavipsychrobacter sp.]|nr:porin family protein [Flavipsychrobacter sp.]